MRRLTYLRCKRETRRLRAGVMAIAAQSGDAMSTASTVRYIQRGATVPTIAVFAALWDHNSDLPMNSSTASGLPPLATEAAVIAVLRYVLSRHVTARVTEWHVRRDNYVVAAV